MNREKLLKYFRTTITIAGATCIGFSLLNLPSHAYSWGVLFLFVFSILIAPRLSLAKPHSNITVDFSEALIFLSFLFYGAEAAVLLAVLEKFANCYYNKWKGNIKFRKHTIAVNISISSISTAAACFLWFQVSRITDIGLFASNTGNLVATLGILAVSQFLVTTFLISIFRYLNDGISLWFSCKRSFFSSSMAQIVGAGITGIFYTVINYGDLITSVLSFAAFGIVYLTYRQSIAEINTSITKAEDAEREKAETERTRRREAERHASQLTISLEKEEKANKALRKSEKDLQHAALYDSLTNLDRKSTRLNSSHHAISRMPSSA